MRGRTNYTGGAMPVINGTLKSYEVAGGYAIKKGDFVQFTALTNADKILGSQVKGCYKIKISDTLYLCMGSTGTAYTYVVCLISLENNEFKVLDTETIMSKNYSYSYPNIVECNGRYYVMDTSESKLYELSVSGNKLTKTPRCTTSVDCPGMTVYNNKIIALGVSYSGTSSSSPSRLSYEVYTVSGDGPVTGGGSKQVNIGTYIYDDVGDVYPKVINGYIYMIGAWYGGSSTTHGGSALCFVFDNSSNTISISNDLRVGSSNVSYNGLFGGNFDVMEECGCYFMVSEYASYKSVLTIIRAGTTVTNLGTYRYTASEGAASSIYPMIYGGLCIPEGKEIALLVHNYYKGTDSESTRNYRIGIQLLNFNKSSCSFTELSKMHLTYESLGIGVSGTGATVYITGSTIMFYNNTFYCMCSIYDNGTSYAVLLTFELFGTNIVFKGLQKIKPYDGLGFSIGFSNQNGTSGDLIDIYVP